MFLFSLIWWGALCINSSTLTIIVVLPLLQPAPDIASNNIDSDQIQHFVMPSLDPKCLRFYHPGYIPFETS